tara:strand:+ start:1255 stop:1554 length:300 start_codon:yes stop_codon:yes gene_type:complete
MGKSFDFDSYYNTLSSEERQASASYATCKYLASKFNGGNTFKERTPKEWTGWHNLKATLWNLTKSKKKTNRFTIEKAYVLGKQNKLPAFYKAEMEKYIG